MGKIWWRTWSEKVKGPDGEIHSKKRYASSHSERKSDAVTLLYTKVYKSQQQGVRPAGQEAEKLTYEEIRDRLLKHRATNEFPLGLGYGITFRQGRGDAGFPVW